MSQTLTNGVIVPDKGSRDWYADLRSNWLKLDSLMAGGNITVNPAQTEGVLVATITVGGKEYKLYQQDGDVSVKIDPSAENAEYPLVASTSAEANTGSVVMAPAVTVNPSTGAVTATSFKGKLEGNGGFAIRAFNGTVNKEFVGYPNGMLAWDNNEILTRVNGVTVDTEQTIPGPKRFANNIFIQSPNVIRGSVTSDVWGKGIIFQDSSYKQTGFINSYYNTNGTMSMKFFGTNATYDARELLSLTWFNNNTISGSLGGRGVLTDANQIMLAKNLSGTNIAPGGVVDCGNGNGKLKIWYLDASGTFVLANTLPTGVWKSASFVTLAPNEGGMFIKIG